MNVERGQSSMQIFSSYRDEDTEQQIGTELNHVRAARRGQEVSEGEFVSSIRHRGVHLKIYRPVQARGDLGIATLQPPAPMI